MKIAVLIYFALALSLMTVTINAAPGDLDPSFGSGGKVIAPGDNAASAVAIQADGKIVVAGYVYELLYGQVLKQHPQIVRYNSDGSRDTSFGVNGWVTEPGVGEYSAVAIQSDGKIVAAGDWHWGSGFDVARFNPDGSRDLLFSSDGVISIGFNGSGEASALAIQPNGRIVVVGTAGNDFAIARIHFFGFLDTSFSNDGKLTIDLSGTDDEAHAVAIHPTRGKIVIAGDTRQGADLDFLVTMLNADGSFDNGFGAFGKMLTDFNGTDDGAYAVAFDGSKVIAAGYSSTSSFKRDFSLLRYNANGTLDTTFSNDGKAKVVFSEDDDTAYAMCLQADGKIVLAGEASPNGDFDFGVARLNNNGSADITFGLFGKVTTSFDESNHERAAAVAIQSDGKLVVVGVSDPYYLGNTLLARYEP